MVRVGYETGDAADDCKRVDFEVGVFEGNISGFESDKRVLLLSNIKELNTP